MNRIDARFQQLSGAGQAAFIPFFTAGDPDLDCTLRLLQEAEGAGADLIELGFAYSDPIADGPTIQESYHRALSGGLRTAQVFDVVARARAVSRTPIVAMVSYSLVYRMGMPGFIERAVDAGLDGATVPDLPIEEALPFFDQARERDFHLVCFVTPATTPQRRAMVVEHAGGFIYYVSVRGTTGERSALPPDLSSKIRELKDLTPVPVAVGFGISEPEQARAAGQVADGAIVGSAIVRRMWQAAQADRDPVAAALEFIGPMAEAVKASR